MRPLASQNSDNTPSPTTDLNPREQQLLNQTIGNTGTQLCLRSATRIDTGRWWLRSRVWVCIAGDQLVVLAVARRHYVERIAIADCSDSHYNHATGELVIAPDESLHLNRFKLSPKDALRILKFLNPESQTQITHQEPC